MKIFSKSLVTVLVFVFILSSGAALAAGPSSVNLLSAGNFAILAKTAVTTTGATSAFGDVGISPAAASYITGFALNLSAGSAFATSARVNGKVYAPGYANPTPSNITTAVSNMETAYTDGMGRTNPTATELGSGNIGGLTIAPGLYKWSTGVIIPTDVTLSGSANDVWIFQIAQNLNISSAKKVILSGGAKASNIYWIVAGQTTIGTTAVFNGNILDKTAIVLNTGAVLNGRALAQTAVTLDASTVTTVSNNESGSATTFSVPLESPSIPAVPLEIPTVPAIPATPAVPTVNPAIPATPASPALNNANNLHSASNLGQQVKAIVTSYNFGTATLKNGSRGSAVMELQRFLNAKLNLGLVIDGKLGMKTIAVIKKWQKDHGLVADGLVGAKTKAQMNAEVK